MGGMGVVWLAEQLEPVRRPVALKIIRAGIASQQIIARFESERQALALMNHPHVAQVYGGGTTRNGHPYFVMEYVSGLPITEHSTARHLSTRERLELFLPVCDAVHHAHLRGIIHRDLKPSNLLVAEEEGAAVPKIIDFGIVRAVDQRLTEHTINTVQGQIVGTPEYMSPEQAQFEPADIDARSDVFALGIVLYELMVSNSA
jgi:serine/threonine protein kinase